MARLKILIVEDESDICDLMTLHLSRAGYDVTAIDDGEKALSLLKENRYDLALLDWMLPGISGVEICKIIQGKLPILMVTARADTADIVLGLECGADDYITKPFEMPIFLARVQALLRRSATLHQKKSDIFKTGNLKIDSTKHEAWCGKNEIKLTLSEFKLLMALLENQGKVLSRSKLIHHVQGEGIRVTDRTVDTHVFGLRQKLGQCADLIESIRGVGYRVKA